MVMIVACLCEFTNDIDLYSLKGWSLWDVNYISKLLFKKFTHHVSLVAFIMEQLFSLFLAFLDIFENYTPVLL